MVLRCLKFVSNRAANGTIVTVLIMPALALAQAALAVNPPPAPTLAHELTLVAIGAALGAVLGPIGQAIASTIGPHRRDRKEQMRVHCEIAEALRDLSAVMQTRQADSAPQADSPACVVVPLHSGPNDRPLRG